MFFILKMLKVLKFSILTSRIGMREIQKLGLRRAELKNGPGGKERLRQERQ